MMRKNEDGEGKRWEERESRGQSWALCQRSGGQVPRGANQLAALSTSHNLTPAYPPIQVLIAILHSFSIVSLFGLNKNGVQGSLKKHPALLPPRPLQTLCVRSSWAILRCHSLRSPFASYPSFRALLSRPRLPPSAIWRTMIYLADLGCLLVTLVNAARSGRLRSSNPPFIFGVHSHPSVHVAPAEWAAKCEAGLLY